jgi:hypothetical protein
MQLGNGADTPYNVAGDPAMPRCRDGLIHRNTGEFDDLAPFLGFVGNQLAEFGGRHRLRTTLRFGK